MTNPVGSLPSAQLPLITTQIVDEAGAATPLFHRFLTGLFLRTGGAAGTSSTDTQALAQEAVTLATTASAEAALAQATASSADAAAGTAQSTANSALNQAAAGVSLANHALATQLTAIDNLSDVPSKSSARSNLGTAYVSYVMSYDTCPDGLHRYIPIAFPMTIPTNLAGWRTWCGVTPTNDTLFAVGYIHNGTSHTLGNINFVHGGTGSYMPVCSSVNLVAGDVLTIQCQSPPDATLAEAAITVLLTIT